MNSKPIIKPFVPRILGPKSWGTETLIAHTPEYTGKVLRMNAGTCGPLQYHEHKNETFYLFSGRAIVRFERADGVLGLHQMLPGEAFHVPPGAVHQVEALDECVLFEASNPVFEDRVGVEVCKRCGVVYRDDVQPINERHYGCTRCQGQRPELNQALGQEGVYDDSKANAG